MARIAKPKRVLKLAGAKKAAPKQAPKAAKPVSETPVNAAKPVYEFSTGYDGPSTGINARPSRQPVNLARFGTLIGARTTQRDQANIAALRKQFGTKPFKRGNIDVGILRRLGERGFITHIAGTDVDPNTTFRFTK